MWASSKLNQSLRNEALRRKGDDPDEPSASGNKMTPPLTFDTGVSYISAETVLNSMSHHTEDLM